MQARDLGPLAGAYFRGYAAIQLPLAHRLDGHGPKRVILCLLGACRAELPGLFDGQQFCLVTGRVGAGRHGRVFVLLYSVTRLFSEHQSR